MRRVPFRLFLVLLVVASTFCLALLGTLSFGHITGEEFAPDTLERRSYSYYELPLVRIQVSSVTHSTNRRQLEQALVDKKYIAINHPPKRWDLVGSFRYGTLWRRGDAQMLCQYLDARTSNTRDSATHDRGTHDRDDGNAWLDWTDRHPELAAILWPEVAKLAREDLYFVTPSLFALVAGVTDPGALRSDLNRFMASTYQELAELEMELKHVETARQYQSESRRYLPVPPSHHSHTITSPP